VALFILAHFRFNWFFISGLAALGFFLYDVRPVIWAWVLDLSPIEVGGSMVSLFAGSQSLLSSVSPWLCGVIADRWGILAACYFLAGTVFVANPVVMKIREGAKESNALVEEPA
jgi:MFS family permease